VKYLLDTNTCIRYLNGRAPSVRRRLEALDPAMVAVCSVVKAELFAGAMKTASPQTTLAKQDDFLDQFVSFPFDDRSARVYGEIRAELERLGTPIGSYDLQIAAIALANGLTLVSHNIREFTRVPELALEDWEPD